MPRHRLRWIASTQDSGGTFVDRRSGTIPAHPCSLRRSRPLAPAWRSTWTASSIWLAWSWWFWPSCRSSACA